MRKQLIPTLKRYGLRWDRNRKTWSLDARLYAYNNRKRQNLWTWARKNQKDGFPVIQAEA